MKKMESVLMVILMVFAFGLAGCGTTPSLPPAPPEMVSLESPLYLIEGENHVEGFLDFWEGLKSFYEYVSLLGGYPLTEVEEYLEKAKKCDSILVIPPIPEGIQEFRDLESKYPDLCPLSCDELESELESYSSPLLYFSRDVEADKIRGIIVATELNLGLAGFLNNGVPLDVPFRYENEQLLILE